MGRIVIFGIADTAQLAHLYLTHDSDHEVVAFSVTNDYLPEEATFEGLPVVPFDTVESQYSPSDFLFFAPMNARRMNRVRASIFDKIKAKGYRMISYVSSKATVFTDLSVGENCFILEDNTIQPYTPIGNNVVLWSGNHIGHHGVIKDHVFFSSHVVLSGHCTVEPYCFFGVNATIRDFTHVTEGSLIGMGACIAVDTEPWGVYTGCPAKKRKARSEDLDF